MYYVYIIQSQSGRHHIGSTENIEKRLEQHNTKHIKKWTIVYSEIYENITLARIREKQIKGYKGGIALKALLDSQGS